MRSLSVSAVAVVLMAVSVGRLSGVAFQQSSVMLPDGVTRPPVAVVLGVDERLGAALRSHGIATLSVENVPATAVKAVTDLRNDPRVSTVTVVGPGDVAEIAARTGRADGYVSMTGAVAGIESRVTAALTPAAAPDATGIASFIQALRPIRHPATQRASLRDTVVGDVGGAHVTIEYGRPSKRGRTIWGTLVPWGRWWMPGADEATVITNSKPIVIGGLAVPAGEHTIYTIPSDDEFMLVINNEVGQFHTEYRPARDLGRVPMTKVAITDVVERMMFALESSSAGTMLKLAWDDRLYSVRLTRD